MLFAVAFALTSSWDQAAVDGVKPRMIFLLLGLLILAPFAWRRQPPLPWWMYAYCAAAVVVTLLQVMLPISPHYIDQRYLYSAAGKALLTRPSPLSSLLSLLLNTLAVPALVVLATLYHRRALRWIIGAYVSGTAVSALAGFLGYIGYPQLLTLLVTAVPAHVRALGFTSHPLHLATSVVFALPLSLWAVLSRHWWLKAVGAFSALSLLLGSYASGSRGGNVACAVALALSLVAFPPVRRRAWAIVGVGAVVAALALIYVPSLSANILSVTRIGGGATATAVSDAGRGEVMHQAVVDFWHSPIFGIGVRYLAEAHVLYIGMLAAGGLILALGFLLFTGGSLGAVIRVRRADPMLGGAFLVTVLSSLVYWTVADDFQVACVQIVFGMIAAALALMTEPEEEPPVIAPRGPIALQGVLQRV